MWINRSNEETWQTLKDRFSSKKPFTYIRFGDVELLLMQYPDKDQPPRHRSSLALQKELLNSFAVRHPDYLLATVAGANLKQTRPYIERENHLRSIVRKAGAAKVYESAVAVQRILVDDPSEFLSFLGLFQQKKVALLSGPTICNSQIVKKAFNVAKVVEVTDTCAFDHLNRCEKEILAAVDWSDIVISALGSGTCPLAWRLWHQGIRKTFFDVGSVVDGLTGILSRAWMKNRKFRRARVALKFCREQIEGF